MDNSATVKIKNVPQSAQKLRLVADLIRGMDATEAVTTLKFLNKKGAKLLGKALNSAIANAKDKYSWEESDLKVSHVSIDEGEYYRKPNFASRGRFSYLTRRRAHINLELQPKK